MKHRAKYLLLKLVTGVIVLLTFFDVHAQVSSKNLIEKAVRNGDFKNAQTILSNNINVFFEQKSYDSVVNYIYWSGRVFSDEKKVSQGNKSIKDLIKRLKGSGAPNQSLMQAYIEAGEYFGYTGNNNEGYESNLAAYDYGKKAGVNADKLASIQNNLATYAQRRGNISLMDKHSREVVGLIGRIPHPDYITLYSAQNMLGNVLFYKSEIDSAAHYFEAAIHSLQRADSTPQNRFYRVAIIQNNISAIYNMQGNIKKGIDTMYAVIENLDKYSQLERDESKRGKSISFRFEAIDNLAGMYKEAGNLTRAEELLKYSYNQKQENLKPDDREIFNSEILLGQLYYAARKYDKALNFTQLGLRHYLENNTGDPLWTGDGYNTLALVYDAKKDYEKAAIYYHLADSLYNISFEGEFDQIYLDFLRNKTEFLAEQKKYNLAEKLSDRSYNYIIQAQGKESIEAFYQILNKSAIAYMAKDYRNAQKYASEGLALLNKKMSSALTMGDSIKMEIYKPRAVLYKVRSQYKTIQHPTEAVIKGLLDEMYDAVNSIEKKKEFAGGVENNRIILAENKELFDFIKMLELDLYRLTGNQTNIHRMMNVQESVLYSKIRSRLQEDSNIEYAGVPASIIKKEQELQTSVEKALASGNSIQSIAQYKKSEDQLSDYRKMLREKYPDYYQLKYRSFLSDPVFQGIKVPENTSVVRYFFVDTSLFALVLSAQSETLVPLNGSSLRERITQIHDPATTVEKVLSVLNDLYQSLWRPFEDKIKNRKVIIIPDGILYSLNMEMLTFQRAHSFRELAGKSLLSRYTISYQYSLSLMNARRQNKDKWKSWVGFAPGFKDDLKRSYTQNVQDSLVLDMGYLKMLPQPFTTSLLKKVKRMYRGEAFLDESSTKSQFLKRSGYSGILHIGSHAFSDNQNPQYSRIVFAKDPRNISDNNLYVHNIYNYTIPTRLTVLSACETGATGYEDGEGMISLAHAFYYAGSESILTSLWEIDEKASSIILEDFYKNLHQGEDKDEALRQAKLAYLVSAKGRDLSPLYWSGLIIMGDTSPIFSQNHSNSNLIWGGIIMLALGTLVVLWYRRRRVGKNDIN